jgi:hypothetical protein
MALMRQPSWSTWSRVFAAVATAAAMVFLFYKHAQQPVVAAAPYADACEATRALAHRALAGEAVRGVELGDCADLNLREQKDLSWVSNGRSSGIRYGAPVNLEWSARVAAFPKGMRLCNLASMPHATRASRLHWS